MIFKFIVIASICITNRRVAFANPAYSAAVKVQNKPGLFPYYAPYSAPVVPLSGGLAQLSAPVGPDPSAPFGCVAPCVIDPAGQYVAQVVPLPSPAISANYVSLPKIVPAYGLPAPVVNNVSKPKTKEDNSYEYSYLVYDEDTGDQKAQRETSDGATVRGQYSLIQPDGYIREVQYTADDLSGFNAVVKNFLPKSPVTSGTKSKLQQAKTSEAADLTAKAMKPVPKIESKDKKNVSSKDVQKPKEATAVDDKDNNGPRKIILTFDDIIRCANLLYGSTAVPTTPQPPSDNNALTTTTASPKVNKSALTYIILPSVSSNNNTPC